MGSSSATTTTVTTMSGSLPKTYKAAVCEEVGKPLVIKDIPMKEPVEGEVLIATEACGVCHSDSVVVEGMMGGTPRVPGHEIIGKIVALGKGTESKGFKVGDRVGSGWHGGHDGILSPESRGALPDPRRSRRRRSSATPVCRCDRLQRNAQRQCPSRRHRRNPSSGRAWPPCGPVQQEDGLPHRCPVARPRQEEVRL